jgi:hypothetical protein
VTLLDAGTTGQAVLDQTIDRLQRLGPRPLDEVSPVIGRLAGWLSQVVSPALAGRGVETELSTTARHTAHARWVDEPLLDLVADEHGGAAAAAIAGG